MGIRSILIYTFLEVSDTRQTDDYYSGEKKVLTDSKRRHLENIFEHHALGGLLCTFSSLETQDNEDVLITSEGWWGRSRDPGMCWVSASPG